jgi:uncharacterized membrane protein
VASAWQSASDEASAWPPPRPVAVAGDELASRIASMVEALDREIQRQRAEALEEIRRTIGEANRRTDEIVRSARDEAVRLSAETEAVRRMRVGAVRELRKMHDAILTLSEEIATFVDDPSAVVDVTDEVEPVLVLPPPPRA